MLREAAEVLRSVDEEEELSYELNSCRTSSRTSSNSRSSVSCSLKSPGFSPISLKFTKRSSSHSDSSSEKLKLRGRSSSIDVNQELM